MEDNASQERKMGAAASVMENLLYNLSALMYDERYEAVEAQMAERAERVFESLVERDVLPPPEGSQEAPELTIELIRKILEVDRSLHGTPPVEFDNAVELYDLLGSQGTHWPVDREPGIYGSMDEEDFEDEVEFEDDADFEDDVDFEDEVEFEDEGDSAEFLRQERRMVDVACIRDVVELDVAVSNGKIRRREEEGYFPERAAKMVAVLRDNGVFPSEQEVYLSEELIRAILAEDMRLAQAGDVPQFYEAHSPRDEGEVERMSWEVWEYLDRQGAWKGRDLCGNAEFVDGVLYHSSMFVGEERREEWREEQEQALQEGRRERHRSFLAQLIRKGVVPDEEGKRVELTMHLIGELVSVGMEWAQRKDKSLHARYVEFWYVDEEAKGRVYDVLGEEYGDMVHVDVEFIGRAFDAIEWRDTM